MTNTLHCLCCFRIETSERLLAGLPLDVNYICGDCQEAVRWARIQYEKQQDVDGHANAIEEMGRKNRKELDEIEETIAEAKEYLEEAEKDMQHFDDGFQQCRYRAVEIIRKYARKCGNDDQCDALHATATSIGEMKSQFGLRS